MSKLLGFDYEWQKSIFVHKEEAPNWVMPSYTGDMDEIRELRVNRLKNSNTHGSFVNLIEDKVELIITARSISRDEKVYADEKGVTLIEKPIAKDALAFMVNIKNPIESLSIEQIQGIYTGDIVNWSEVGGLNYEIHPYVRNRNSGSQEKFETMVMVGLTIKELPEMRIGKTMMTPYFQLDEDSLGLAFTPFYYFSYISGTISSKVIGVNGVPMTKENIKNGTYPYLSNVYAAVRSDIDKSSLIVEESGYVPLRDTSTGIWKVKSERVNGEKYDDAVYDLSGRKIDSSFFTFHSSFKRKGINIIRMSDGASRKVLIK